jgi:hypothetical protein
VRHYILTPIVTTKRNSTSDRAIAFDPDMRAFQTGFNSDGNFVEYDKGEIKKLFCFGKENRCITIQDRQAIQGKLWVQKGKDTIQEQKNVVEERDGKDFESNEQLEERHALKAC